MLADSLAHTDMENSKPTESQLAWARNFEQLLPKLRVLGREPPSWCCSEAIAVIVQLCSCSAAVDAVGLNSAPEVSDGLSYIRGWPESA